MDRRQLLKMITAATGTALIGGNTLLAGCSRPVREVGHSFDKTDVALLDEVAETILPRTDDAPGAKDAQVGQFMTVMVDDCYTETEQAIFHEGLKQLDATARDRFQAPFMELTQQERHELLSELDERTRDMSGSNISGEHYYIMLKQLTLLGYFTSEIAAKEAMRFVAVPGRFDGCMPYEKGDRAWATT